MNKKWDYDVPSVEIWKECFRVLKPGGYLLSFAGTRTQHRMACNIEDAGFEIRDMIAWVYGSGFPKSLNIGKAVDALQGNERAIIGIDQNAERFKKYKEQDGCTRKSFNNKLTKGNSEYEGWGTALKPALEPITVARKPLSEKTVAENVLKYGTGGINIDGCRVESLPGEYDIRHYQNEDCFQNKTEKKSQFQVKPQPSGRFPANFIHDGSDEVVEWFPESSGGAFPKESNKSDFFKGIGAIADERKNMVDKGSAARFFYCAKATKKERGESNNHPTVKPVDLMRYLVRLVTPKGGICCDPFAGSGTTGVACIEEGFDYILIEQEKENIDIINDRLKEISQQGRLFQ